MPIDIGEITTEIIAEPEERPVPATPPDEHAPAQLAAVRTQVAELARQILRTRAEGFDD